MRLAQKSWSEIDWDNDVKEKAKKFRRRIRGAIATGNTDKAFEHADKMLNSHYECLLAVRKVTEKRRERTTPGIDGLTYQTDAEKMALVQRLREDSGAEPNPLKVAVVPKKDGGTRELAIPTVFDRARQTLLAAVLTVLNDHRFGPGSFGVGGKRRGVHGAYGAICKHLYGRHMFALRTDIRNCFGEISRSPLLDSLVGPQKLKEQAHMFLDSGLWVDGEVVHSDRGAPQGMPLSPLLVNLALSGLEAEVMSLLPDDVGAKPLFIRYVDDIIILHRDPEVIKECYLNLGDCLEEYELLLNREKPASARRRSAPAAASKPR